MVHRKGLHGDGESDYDGNTGMSRFKLASAHLLWYTGGNFRFEDFLIASVSHWKSCGRPHATHGLLIAHPGSSIPGNELEGFSVFERMVCDFVSEMRMLSTKLQKSSTVIVNQNPG